MNKKKKNLNTTESYSSSMNRTLKEHLYLHFWEIKKIFFNYYAS